MTVRELIAVLATADPAAEVYALDAYAAYRARTAAVWGTDDFEYTGLGGKDGDVVVSLEASDE